MTLRLVLVSLVAALGLTIPGGPMIESWVASTQNWMNARFADWDTRNPQEADYVIINDHYDGARRGSSGSPHARRHRPLETRAPEPAATGAKPVPAVSLTVASTASRGVVRPASFVRKAASFTPIATLAATFPASPSPTT